MTWWFTTTNQDHPRSLLRRGFFDGLTKTKHMARTDFSNTLFMRCLGSLVLIASTVSSQAPVFAGTLSSCGWRGTTDLRCYEETNGCFNFQDKTSGTCHAERYWPGGVNEARPWCHANGGRWLPADDSRQLSERCSLP